MIPRLKITIIQEPNATAQVYSKIHQEYKQIR